jgi:hypothetical protein
LLVRRAGHPDAFPSKTTRIHTHTNTQQEDAEIAAAVDAAMRARDGDSSEQEGGESSEGGDDTPGKQRKAAAAAKRKQQQPREGTPGLTGTTDGDEDASDGEQQTQRPDVAALKARAAAAAGKLLRGTAAAAADLDGEGRTVRGSAGGKKPDDPLLNYVVSEDGLSCTIEVGGGGQAVSVFAGLCVYAR